MFALLKKLWLGIDGFILLGCQRISDNVYEKTGRSNFSLANIFLNLAFLVNTAMLFMVILYRENLTVFGILFLYVPVALIYIAISLQPLLLRSLTSLTGDTLYDNSEELKITLMEWGKTYSSLRRYHLAASFQLLGVFALALIISKPIPNPFSDPLCCYVYLSQMFILSYSIHYYFASCKTVWPIKGKVALMVAG